MTAMVPPRCIIFFSDTGVSRSHRTLLLTLCLSPCCFDIPFFPVSSTPFIRSDDPRMFVWHGCHTILTSIQPSHRQYCHYRSRSAFFSSSPVYFGTQYISRKPTRLIFSHAQVIRYLSFPPAPTIFIHPDPKPEQWGSPREKFLPPPFGCPPRGYLVAWPIDCVCVPVIAQFPCVTSDGSRTCTIFFVHPFPSVSQASIPRRDSRLDLLSLFIQWTTYLSPLPVTLILLQPHFLVLETSSLRSASHTI